MLSEGGRRAERGTRVVVACVETYGRPQTEAMLAGLTRIPPRVVVYRGRSFDEMDLPAVLAEHPEVALVDELAHTNVPGLAHGKRWEDVLDLLAEGIEVISTINVQHIESLNDVVADATGVRQRETVPDWVIDLADQVELVDMSPHALRRRMVHGNVYPDPRKAELALNRFFTTDNLTALRELALMRVANQVDETLLSRWTKGRVPETRERVLVCVSHPESAADLIRRGARIAQRARGDLLVVHARGSPGVQELWLEETSRLVADLGGELHVIDDDDAVGGVLGFAYRQFVTQLVVGEPLRSRFQELLRGSFVNELIRRANNIDIHVMARRER
jgi:two-component system sensor histidine kinase KdpD